MILSFYCNSTLGLSQVTKVFDVNSIETLSFMKRKSSSDQYEWGMLKIWEVASDVYVDELEHLDEPECNLFLQFSLSAYFSQRIYTQPATPQLALIKAS